MKPQVERREFECVRHGTQPLIAAFEVGTLLESARPSRAKYS